MLLNCGARPVIDQASPLNKEAKRLSDLSCGFAICDLSFEMNMYFAGVDIGSAYAKAVVLDERREIRGWSVAPSGNDYRVAADAVLDGAVKKAGLVISDLSYIAATGCGAGSVLRANRTLNEITANGRAANYLFPPVSTVIDIGAQFSRVFRVDGKGNVTDFVVSEKCAAGSGRLLQVISRVLQVDITELGNLSLNSTKNIEFTTSCAVFIESEVISRIAEGVKKEDIIAGVHRSLAAKVSVMSERLGAKPDFCFVGGAAANSGLVKSLEGAFNSHLHIPENPQLTGAIGAAIMAGTDHNSKIKT